MKFYLYILIPLVLLSACVIPEVKQNDEKHLLIVSDYLDSSDIKLFQKFIDNEKVDIEIKNLNANNIIGSFRNYQYGTGIDVIMLESLYDVKRISKLDYLASIDWFEEESTIDNRFYSTKYNYIGYGLDPYVFMIDPDSISPHRTYTDLRHHPYYTTHEDKELIPLYSSILSRMSKVDAYNWIKSCEEQQQERWDLPNTKTVISKLSKVPTLKNDSLTKRYSKTFYPNQNGTGAFYDLRTICIVNQAENFQEAKNFIKHCLSQKNNEQLNQQLRTASVTSKTNFRSFKTRSEELLQYYGMVERIQNKLN